MGVAPPLPNASDISSLYHREFHFFLLFFMYLFLIFIRPNVLLSPFTIYSTPPELGKPASLLRPRKDWAVFPPSFFSLWLNISHLTVYSIWNLWDCGCGWGEGLIAAWSLPGEGASFAPESLWGSVFHVCAELGEIEGRKEVARCTGSAGTRPCSPDYHRDRSSRSLCLGLRRKQNIQPSSASGCGILAQFLLSKMGMVLHTNHPNSCKQK